MIKKGKQKLMKIAEIIHLKFFGHSMSDMMREFLGNLSWSFFGGIIAAGIMFMVNIFAGRILGPEEYGKYALVIATSAIFIIPMTLGLDTATVYYVAKNKNKKIQRKYIASTMSIFIILMLMTTIGLYFFREILANIFSTKTNIINITILFSISLAFKNILDSFVRGLRMFKYQALLKIFETTTILVFFVVVYFLLKQILAIHYVEIMIISYILVIVALLIKFKKYFQISFLYKNKLLLYGFYALLGSISGILLNSFDKIFINRYIGGDKLGIYNAYYMSSIIIVGQLSIIFTNVFFSHLSSVKDKKIILKKINKLSKAMFIPVFFILSGVISAVIVLFGEKYPLDIILVLEFSFFATLTSYFTILWWLIASQGRQGMKFTSMHGIMSGLIFIFLSLIFQGFLSIYLVVVFLIISLFYAVLMGNLKGIK